MSILGQIMQQQVFVQSGWYQRQSGVLLPLEVREILRKYNGTAIIPGAAGTAVYEFAPGNYVESTGQTLTAIDKQVGLVVDAAGSVGPELAPGNNLSGFTNSQDTTHTNTGFTTTTGGKGVVLSGLVVNKTYEIVVSGSTTSAEFSVNTADAALPKTRTLIRTGFGRAIFKADYTYLYLRHSDAATSSNISISIRELPGIHATQATDGYKPIERRGLVNLLTYSNDFGNAVWVKSAVSFSGGKLIEDSSNAAHQLNQNLTVTSGSTCTYVAVMSAAERTQGLLQVSVPANAFAYFNLQTGVVVSTGSGAVGAFIHDLGSGRYLCGFQLTPDSTTAGFRVRTAINGVSTYLGDGTSGIYLHSAALFQGTVTAQQIIDAGGIPVTTDKPASSAKGVNYLEFDGVDDRMQLSQVPFQMADDHWVVAGVTRGATGATRRIFHIGSGGDTQRVANLSIAASGAAEVSYRSDTSPYVAVTGPSVLPESPSVLSATSIASSIKLRVNSSVVATGTTPSGTTTLTAAAIGAHTAGGSYFNGKIHAVFFGKGAITDSELLTLEKFAAKLQGRSL